MPKFENWLTQNRSDYVPTPFPIPNENFSRLYALSYHGQTRFSRLVRSAKTYGNEIPTERHRRRALELATFYEKFMRTDNTYIKSDYLVAVPFQEKSYDLPHTITASLCGKLLINNGSDFVVQVRHKEYQQKELETIEDKRRNVAGLFQVTNKNIFSGKVITIIDDVYSSGTTIDEVATVLKNVGAIVQGLVATKTIRD